ncbi:MAG: penicillin-binding protein 2 [Candidatus Doudnabacteria bacterium]|nr:penicillin-binding protein 2 [Candidatus Doudnabacteria bacterium]
MNVLSSNLSDPKKSSFNKRIFLLMLAFFAFGSLIFFRLFNLQVVNHGFYADAADNQHGAEQKIQPKRGEIFLSSHDGDPLLVATNLSLNTAYAQPKLIEDAQSTSVKLAPVLGMKASDLRQKIENGNKNYVILKKQLTEDISRQVRELGLPGIGLEPETMRFYPEGELGSHVLGFVGFSAKGGSASGGKETIRAGQYGIEGRFEGSLSGSQGIIGVETDVAGRWITFASRNLIPAQDGDDIYLTIDSAIQYKAQEVLNKTVSEHGAEGGCVVVLNPQTGAVLALAVNPGFNPNEYNKVPDISYYTNKVLAADYEPGSVFKPITMAAALDEEKVNPETTYEDRGLVEFPENLAIRNSDNEAHGVATMTEVLEKSLNTGAVFAQQEVGPEAFKKYVSKFGFGQLSKIELPGEVLGNLSNLNKKGDIFFATASFGQGITVTPIQMASAFAAIANGGKLMKPYVVSKFVHPDQTEEAVYPEERDQIITQKTAATLSAMLVNVVENGHGKRAGVKGYYIAGKTGTAQVAYKDRSGYDPSKNIGSFVGFGPVDDPAFVMLVRIDHPKDVKFAESTAAPAFGEIAGFILNYLQVPPSR